MRPGDGVDRSQRAVHSEGVRPRADVNAEVEQRRSAAQCSRRSVGAPSWTCFCRHPIRRCPPDRPSPRPSKFEPTPGRRRTSGERAALVTARGRGQLGGLAHEEGSCRRYAVSRRASGSSGARGRNAVAAPKAPGKVRANRASVLRRRPVHFGRDALVPQDVRVRHGAQ